MLCCFSYFVACFLFSVYFFSIPNFPGNCFVKENALLSYFVGMDFPLQTVHVLYIHFFVVWVTCNVSYQLIEVFVVDDFFRRGVCSS